MPGVATLDCNGLDSGNVSAGIPQAVVNASTMKSNEVLCAQNLYLRLRKTNMQHSLTHRFLKTWDLQAAATAIRKLLYGEMRHWLEANASTWQARRAGFCAEPMGEAT